jgi:hypothetical protein
MKRALVIVVMVLSTSLVSACSTYELEGLGAAFDHMDGVIYADESRSLRRPCPSGSGFVTQYLGVRSNSAYSYVYNNSNQELRVTHYISEESQGREEVRPGQQSNTVWFHPSRTSSIEISC